MPLQKLEFRPGINREGTSLANEGGWFESDKIRFRSGYPEKIGGWTLDAGQDNSTTPTKTFAVDGTSIPAKPAAGVFWGVCRTMWNWLNLSGFNLLALGTNLKFYIQNGTGGIFYDITPIRNVTTAGEATFSALSGSSTVTVLDAGHGAQTGDFVIFSGAGNLGGNITADLLNREYQITYLNSNLYTITVSVVSNFTGSGGGSSTVASYQITSGNEIFTQNVGWGAGTWGGGITGTPTTTLATALNSTTLSAALSSSATTINVVSATAFASSGSIWIGDELITYSGKTGTSFTGCTRATGGTTAFSYPSGMPVAENSTSVVLTSATGFSTPTGIVLIDNEIIFYTGISTNTLTGCTRAASGTRAAGHTAGATVTQSTTFTAWGDPSFAGQGVGEQLRVWSEANFGEDLIFNPRGGAMYYWANSSSASTFNRAQLLGPSTALILKTGTITPDSSCPSVSNLVTVSDAQRFVIAFGCNDYGTTVQNPMLIRWSDQEDVATWAPQVTNQAGSFQLSHGSQIVAYVQTRQEILVYTDTSIYSMQYLGPPYVWGFQLMGDNISIMGPNAAVTANNVTYWMGTDKFYMYTGRVETLPCSVRQYVYDDINLTQSFQIFSGTNEGYNEVWWFYCSLNSDAIDKYVVFNHLERTWYYGTLARSYWLDSPLRASPMAAGYNGQLIYHESGNDDGTTNPPSPIEAYVQSSDFDIGDGHNFGLVTRIIPDVTFDGSTVNNPSLDFTVRPRQFPGTNYGTSDSPTVTSADNYQNQRYYNVQQFTEQVFVRVRGRQMAFKVISNDLGVAWQLGVPRIDTRPDGRR